MKKQISSENTKFKGPSDEIESRVKERTRHLLAANARLRRQIAKQKKTEEELVKSRERLRELSAHLESAREEERTIISREIHDELGQTLSTFKFALSWVHTHLLEEQEEIRARIEAMLANVDLAIKQMRGLSAELRPSILDDFGISAAIEWFMGKFQYHTGIRCTFRADPEETDLSKEQRIAIFRICQQALTNVGEHAQATTVEVLLREKNGNFTLTVQDNGIGITEEQISAPRSVGILGMSERAISLNGKLKIKGVKDRGTTLTVSIPLDAERIDT